MSSHRTSSWRASTGSISSKDHTATTPYTPNDRTIGLYPGHHHAITTAGQSPSSSTLAISPLTPHLLGNSHPKHSLDPNSAINNNTNTNTNSSHPPFTSTLYKSINNNFDSPRAAGKSSGGTLNVGGQLLHHPTPLSQVERLRLWRHDAIMQHHYQTAEYIGDKILALTNDPNDAFWLAQVFYLSGQYTRARQLLMRQELDRSVSCRYLAALCLTKMGKWEEALGVLGERNPFATFSDTNSGGNKDLNNNFVRVKNQDGGIKLEASMCFLRGQIYTNQNNFDQAKECYKEAVRVDAKCFEAFDQLIRGSLLTPREEWELLTSLDFEESCNGDSTAAELVKALYTTRLGKFENLTMYKAADQLLTKEYELGDNPDVLLSRADLLFVQCKFKKCLDVCDIILKKDKFRFSAMPDYLACLHELGKRNKLFLVAHELVDNHPDEAVSWLAVGVYYLTIGKILEARRYFSKSSMMSPFFGQAWIGFAHTFAVEGEHEQAISAYTTAARLFQGTHLPSLFLGMQHLQLNNLTLAEEYLQVASSICDTDPLLLNERGVVHYHKNELQMAESYFVKAQKAAEKLDSDPRGWLSIKANLGHVYRRMGKYYDALEYFEEVLRITPQDSNIYSAMGLANLQGGNVMIAIENFHSALAISPNDAVATDLLRRALEDCSNMGVWDIVPNDDWSYEQGDPVNDLLYINGEDQANALAAAAIEGEDDLADIIGTGEGPSTQHRNSLFEVQNNSFPSNGNGITPPRKDNTLPIFGNTTEAPGRDTSRLFGKHGENSISGFPAFNHTLASERAGNLSNEAYDEQDSMEMSD